MFKNLPLGPVLMVTIAAGMILYSVLKPDPQLGGRFEGIPYEVFDDAAFGPDAGWTVYLMYGQRGTDDWKEIRLYGVGQEFLPMLQAAIETQTWLEFETTKIDWPMYAQWGIQGYITAVNVSESQGYPDAVSAVAR